MSSCLSCPSTNDGIQAIALKHKLPKKAVAALRDSADALVTDDLSV